MKNIGVKILILTLCCSVAVAGVLIFWKTIVEPPMHIDIESPHVIDVERDINNLKNSEGGRYQDNDKLYEQIADKLRLYKEEMQNGNDMFLTNEQFYTFANDLVNTYAPRLNAWGNFTLNNSWTKTDLDKLNNRRKDLIKFAGESGVSFKREDLDFISNAITSYNKAMNVAKNTTYNPDDNSIDRINNVSSVCGVWPLNNCEELQNMRSNYAQLLGASHYNYIKNLVDNKVAKYSLYSNRTEWEKFCNQADEEIQNYISYCNENSSYSGSKDIYTLSSKNDEYKSLGTEYFNSLENQNTGGDYYGGYYYW